MGKWEGTREWVTDINKELFPMPKNDFEKALQAADYIASRKTILDFDFAPTENVVLPVNESNNQLTNERRVIDSYSFSDLENYIIPFGKHSGSTISEIHNSTMRNGSSYIDWMAKQEEFNFKYERDLARKFLYLLDNSKYKQYGPNTQNNSHVILGDDLPF